MDRSVSGYNPAMDTPPVKPPKHRTRPAKPVVPAALLKVRAVAAFLSVSVRQVWDLTNEGQMPRSLKLGGGTFWRRSELEDWIDAGMPRLSEWDQMAAERKAARDR